MAKYYVFRLLVCDVCVGSNALSIPGGLILHLFKQLMSEYFGLDNHTLESNKNTKQGYIL